MSTVNGKWSEVFIKWAGLKRPVICEKDWVDSEEVGVVPHGKAIVYNFISIFLLCSCCV